MGTPSLFTTIVPITPWNREVFLFTTTWQSYSELWWQCPMWTWWAPPRFLPQLCQSHPEIRKFYNNLAIIIRTMSTWWAPPRCLPQLCQSHPEIVFFILVYHNLAIILRIVVALSWVNLMALPCWLPQLYQSHSEIWKSSCLPLWTWKHLGFTSTVLTAPWNKSKKRNAEHASFPVPDNQDWVIYILLLWCEVWRKRNRAWWVTVPSRQSELIESGSGSGSRVLMRKNWRKKIQLEKIIFFYQKLQLTVLIPLGLVKGRPS